MNKNLLLSSYDYILPPNLIATKQINPRDNAKMLVYKKNSDEIIHAHFKDILSFLPKECVVLLNDTKVIKAKINGIKQSGGKVSLLFENFTNPKAYIKGKVKQNSIIKLKENIYAKVINLHDNGLRDIIIYNDKTNQVLNTDEILNFLQTNGQMPLPPYIKREENELDDKTYQSVFAKNLGAIAAPTASLHFTNKLLKEVQEKHIVKFLTLHVGSGTFKSVSCEDIRKFDMHEEFFNLNEEVANIIKSDKKILSVGTTVTRVVEDFIRHERLNGTCKLFLNPINKPQRVDFLLTNFHLPKTTLLMLVASFIGLEKTKKLYEIAINAKYRFFSYGDCMLIL